MKDYTLKLVDILETAARAERFIPGIKKPQSPGMYSILEIIHNKSEHGAYHKTPMKIRATGKMLASWELAIDLLLLISTEERKLLWSRANKYSYSEIGRMLGYERRKVKTLYLNALFELENKLYKRKDILAKLDKIS